MREVLLRLALILGAAGITGGLAELALRGLAARADAREYAAFRKSRVPGLDYEFVPGARLPWAGREIRINRQGFRGADFPETRSTTPRIAVIGDSIAAGYGVAEEEAFPSRLAAEITGGGTAAEVLNFGVPGYNLDHLVALWQARVAAFEPELVVYAMCLNDGRPELRLNAVGVLEPAGAIDLTPTRAQPGRLPVPGKRWLAEHSALYRLTMSRYDLLLRRLGVRAEPLPVSAELDLLYDGSPEAVQIRGRLMSLVESVRQRGADLILLCFPTADQLGVEDPRPQAALKALSASLGVTFIDLHPAFVRASRAHGHVFDADGLHPNAVGHETAARELVGAVQGWLSHQAGAAATRAARPRE